MNFTLSQLQRWKTSELTKQSSLNSEYSGNNNRIAELQQRQLELEQELNSIQQNLVDLTSAIAVLEQEQQPA